VSRELAVFGGSFDPPHIGHVFLAAYALSVGVERVLVVPTFQHAFDKQLQDFAHRMRMCELAFSLLPAVEVSPIEQELGGISRTLRLVEALATRYPGYQLRLLVGADILLQAHRWHRFDEIRAIAPLLVAQRGGYGADAADAGTLSAGPLLPEVSSTAIRASLARGDDVSTWVPAQVRAYVEAHQLYRASTT